MEQKIEKKKFTILGIDLWEILAYFIIYSIAGFFIETMFALVRYGVYLKADKAFYMDLFAVSMELVLLL